MAVQYLNITEADFLRNKRIQKFLSLERALQLLENKKLWFSNPAKWPDPFERRFIDGEYDGGKPFTWHNRVYCMCITPNATSEASWKAYSENDFAVKLEFARQEYVDILNRACGQPGVMDVFFGTMDYQQTRDIEKPLSKIEFSDGAKLSLSSKLFKARLLLLKRKAFAYESEYRAIIVKKDTSNAAGISVDIPNILSLVQSITIGPTVGDGEYKMIKKHLISEYKFRDNQIMQSRLYKASTRPKIGK